MVKKKSEKNFFLKYETKKKRNIYICIYEYIKKNRNESIKGSEKKKETSSK